MTLEELQAENQRLTSSQVKPAELATLLAERAAVVQLQAELDSLRRRASESAAAVILLEAFGDTRLEAEGGVQIRAHQVVL